MEIAASVVEFQKGYFLNGRLRLDDADTGQLLARKDAFLPLNVIVNPEGFDAQIARCLKEAESRRDLSQRVWRAPLSPAEVSYSIDLAKGPSTGTPDADIAPEA
jgi:hypothetical protein